MAIKINNSAGGSITLDSTTATNDTLTLPSGNGTILDSTSALDATKLTGTLPAISGANLTGVAPTKATIEGLGIAASSITGALPAIDGSALTGVGNVLQVVSATNTSTPFASTTSTALVSSGFSINITPKQIGSTIRVQFHTNLWKNAAGGGGISIYNGSTNLHASADYGMGDFAYSNAGTDDYFNVYTEIMYTTTSLSTQTFTLWFRSWTGGTIGLNQHAGIAVAVATEIKQ